MVECTSPIDLIFASLADATRRDMLRRLAGAELTISELARPYRMSLAAIAKHVAKLELAGLVSKRRSGKERIVSIAPEAIRTAAEHLGEYEKLWAARYDALENLLNTTTNGSNKSV